MHYSLAAVVGMLGLLSALAAIGWPSMGAYGLVLALGVNFLVLAICIAVAAVFSGKGSSISIKQGLLSGFVFYSLLIVSFWFLGRTDVLWVPDSHTLHGPGVLRASQFLKGEAAIQFASIFGEQIQLTYIWAAIGSWVFGINPVSTALSNLALKLLTWLAWGISVRKYFGDKIATLTLLFLMFIPTQIFYGLVFYKEPMVQLLTVIVFAASLEVFHSGSFKYLFIGLIAVIALVIERIYLAPMMGLTLLMGFLPHANKLGWNFRTASLATLFAFAVVGAGWIFFRDFSLLKIFENLAWLRHNYMNAPGVDKAWNQDIPYVLAFVKIVFTPFFHPNKLEVFKDFSAFLTWGAIPSQIVTLLSIFGVWIEVRKAPMRTLLLILPFVLFLLLFAYLAPYSGRQRDSFYPVISVFAAIAIVRIAEKLNSVDMSQFKFRKSPSTSL